jgi:hypothetical protein
LKFRNAEAGYVAKNRGEQNQKDCLDPGSEDRAERKWQAAKIGGGQSL